MKLWTQHLVSAARATLVVVASVATFGVGLSAHAADVTTLHDHPVIAPLQLIDGDYTFETPSDKKAQCVKVKTKLELKRTAFKASSEWRAVTGSDAYKSFADSHKGLKEQKCNAAAAGAEEEACKALTDKVTQHANALAETTQYKALTTSKSWTGLMGEFAQAQKLGCIKANPPKEAIK